MLDDVPLPDFKPERMAGFLGALIDADDPPPEVPEHPGSVSYTHLTLPTIYSV